MDTIGFDLGTSNIKAVRWNPEQGVVARVVQVVPLHRPAPNNCEIDAEEYMSLVMQMIRELAAPSGRPISAISFAAASGNTVLCDKEGRALTPIISWLDNRIEWYPPEEWNVREVTGWVRIPSFPLMHFEYFRRTSPELLHTAQVSMSNELVTWRLCGKRALDYSNATPFYLADQVTHKYATKYLEYYGITEEQLPRLVPTGTTIGTLLPEHCYGDLSTDTRIVAGSFDHPSGARGAGITEPGELMLSCGTSWVGFYPAAKREDVPANELCDPYRSCSGGPWCGMFSVGGIGVDVENFVQEHYGDAADRYDRFNAEAMQDGSDACKLMLDVLDKFNQKLAGRKFGRTVMIGGPSEGSAWHHHLKTHLGIDFELSPYRKDTGAVGAAMIAAGLQV